MHDVHEAISPEIVFVFPADWSHPDGCAAGFCAGSVRPGRKGYPKSGQASEAKTLLNREGEWSSLRLQARGNTFSCWINGKKASEYTDATFSGAAPLGLQIHGDVVMKVEYRNLRIADLAAGEGKTH